MIRCVISVLIPLSMSSAFADPILLLLLRVARDRAVSASLEAGVNGMRPQYPSMQTPAYGFALPMPPIPRGNDEQ